MKNVNLYIKENIQKTLSVNKSKTYLLPYIDQFIKIKFINRLNNTYVFLNDEYRICLRYEYSGKKEFTDYEKELEENQYYEKTIDINKKEVLYVFHFPVEMLDEVDLFLSGKISYSRTPDPTGDRRRDNHTVPAPAGDRSVPAG